MTIVILAAGASRRMGRQKLLLPIDGQPMIERAITASANWPTVVVAGVEVAAALAASPVRIVLNREPERGMSHSLKLGDRAIAGDEAIAVLLADLPDISHSIIAAAIEAYDDTIDVVVPRCGENFAHPVIFGPLARRRIAALPDGDTIKRLRDDPRMRRRVIEVEPGAMRDIDTPGDYLARGRPAQGTVESSP